MTNLLRKRFRYKFFNATIILTAINVLIYILTKLSPNLRYILAMNPQTVLYHHMYWQLVTSMFVHANLQHLFFNMFGLLMFGINVEKSMGSKEFLLFYFVCGILSTALSLGCYVLTSQYHIFLMGASGALFSVLFAFAVIFPTVRVFIFGVIPVPGPILIVIYTIIELGSQFLGIGGNIAHMTHLFGFAAAWAYFLVRIGVNPITVWKNVFRH
ncbi:rhomboid family intramembrane serine protease [Treponema sp.]|uniref:rhomboid family intramembrane serine protease n=1 Tax=Treponema sp. TaxID=166 RepID=UPI00298DDE18|nr:rhomboid family intramembrane serine protease [Treponema sp.]MCR5613960.1 rhomboid family intramembrane serine protease [Treponema sp.]